MKRLIMLLSLLGSASFGADLAVSALTCEFMSNPRGIKTPAPRLSWKLDSDQRDVAQTAYRIEVARSAEKLAAGEADLWDSGRVASDQSYLVPYAGTTLASRQSALSSFSTLPLAVPGAAPPPFSRQAGSYSTP